MGRKEGGKRKEGREEGREERSGLDERGEMTYVSDNCLTRKEVIQSSTDFFLPSGVVECLAFFHSCSRENRARRKMMNIFWVCGRGRFYIRSYFLHLSAAAVEAS